MMNRRTFLAKAGLWGASLSFLPQLNAAAQPKTDRPNIVYILADDLGWNDVSFHGSEIRTPNIDKLAQEGVILNRFYVCPVCSPTRAGIMTGRYPIRYGMQTGVVTPTERHGLPTDELTLAAMLAQAGYEPRAMIGKWHLGHASTMFHPLRHGFTRFYGHYNGAIDYFSHERSGQLDWHRNYDSCYDKGYSTDLFGAEAVRLIRQSDPTSPFYIHVSFNASHSPLQAKEEDLEAYGFNPKQDLSRNTDASLAAREGAPDYGEKGRGNNVRQTYSAITAALDRQVGEILKAIDEKGIRDNTIVVFHSDNGGTPKHGGDNRPLRGNKFTTWEGGVRAVAVLRWPKQLQGGTTCNTLMGYIDMCPTLAAAAGCTGADGKPRDGIDMLPILKGEKEAPDRPFHLGADAVITQDWKLVRNHLYAIAEDPNEKTDVAEKHPEIVEKLTACLDAFKKMQGPACQSSLPRPASWPPPEWKIPEE